MNQDKNLNFTSIKKLVVGCLCAESYPCQHDVKIIYVDGTESEMSLEACSIHALWLECEKHGVEVESNYGKGHFKFIKAFQHLTTSDCGRF